MSADAFLVREKLPMRDRLIVALDLSTANAAAPLAEKLHGRVGMFKVGSQIFTAEGPELVRRLVAQGEKVFLDLKFHDIPNTVRAAAREAAQLGVSMLNVHAFGGRRMMEAALEGVKSASVTHARNSRPLVLAVTVLTSLSSEDLAGAGLIATPEESVLRLARLAQDAGLDGVVASPQEIGSLRRICGPRFVIVTPGIRPAGAPSDDQARIATPESAIQAGADYLVVGRPIVEASDPVAAAEAVISEMERAALRASTSGTAQ